MLKNYAQEENVKFPWRKKNTTESAPYHYFITKKLFKWNHIVSLCSWKLCKILRVAVRFASFLLLGFVSQTLNLIGNGVIREVNVFIFLSLSLNVIRNFQSLNRKAPEVNRFGKPHEITFMLLKFVLFSKWNSTLNFLLF